MGQCGSGNIQIQVGPAGPSGTNGLLGVQAICNSKDGGGTGVNLLQATKSTLDDPNYWLNPFELILQPGSYIFDFSAWLLSTVVHPEDTSIFNMYIVTSLGVVLQDLANCCFRQQTIGQPDQLGEVVLHDVSEIISIQSGIVVIPATARIRVHGGRLRAPASDAPEIPYGVLRAIKIL